MFDIFNTLWAELRDEGCESPARSTPRPTSRNATVRWTSSRHPLPTRKGRSGVRAWCSSHVETRVVRCPFAVAFAEHGDPARFAHEYIPTLRSWSEATFAAGLAPSRPGAERQAILGPVLRYLRVTGADFARRTRDGLRSLLPGGREDVSSVGDRRQREKCEWVVSPVVM